MPYILFERTDGVRGFIETAGVMVVPGTKSGEFNIFEHGSDSAVRCSFIDGKTELRDAISWVRQVRE